MLNSKFRKKAMVQPCLNGSHKNSDMAECFADYFSSVRDTADKKTAIFRTPLCFRLAVNMHFMILMIQICLVSFL